MKVVGVDPGLGTKRPGFGTGLVIIERAGSKWRVDHSELIEGRTDKATDIEIAWNVYRRMYDALLGCGADLLSMEDIEFQGVARAQHTIRVSRLVGYLQLGCRLIMGEPKRLVMVRRTEVLGFLGAESAEQAEHIVRRMVGNSASMKTEHEVCAAAAAIVGHSKWQAEQRRVIRRTA